VTQSAHAASGSGRVNLLRDSSCTDTFAIAWRATGALSQDSSHIFAEEGNYTLTVTVTHEMEPTLTQMANYSVADAPLTAGTLTPPAAATDQAISNAVLFHFSDADPNGTASDYVATVTWGDGLVENSTGNPSDVKVVASPTGGFDVLGSHTYTASGTGLSFQVAVLDQGGASTSASASITVSGNVVIQGAPGTNKLVLSAGSSAGSLTYTLNGGAPVVLSNVRTLTFNGGRGNNTMTVNLGPNNLLPSAIKFDGGRGSNTLVLNAEKNSNTIFITQAPNTSPFGLGQITSGPRGTSQITGRQVFTYTNVRTVRINNATAVNAEVGPRTSPRSTVFNGLNPQERAVQALYLAALGRAGSKAELDLWTVFLAPGATNLSTTVVSGIENSFEAEDHLVKSWYIAYLGRPAHGGEELVWVNLLRGGLSEEKVLSLILSDRNFTEFYNRAQTLITSGTPDERYVQSLHELLLNRPATASELANGVVGMATMGRAGYVLSLLRGPEFRTDQFEGYYNALLHRPAEPTGLNSWLMSNLDIHSVRIGFETSPEFFAIG
jgi:hypothetical protein